MCVSTCQALVAYERVAVRACTDFRTLAALTASNARVTCEIFFTLLIRSRISRADAIGYAFQVLRKVSSIFNNLARFSSVISFLSVISLPISGWEDSAY